MRLVSASVSRAGEDPPFQPAAHLYRAGAEDSLMEQESLERLRHSTAHVMAQAVKALFPEAKLAIGPPIQDGFYYDFDVARPFTPEDLEKIEARMREIVAANHPITRSEMSREEAIRFFEERGEPYKVELIREIPEETVSLYTQDHDDCYPVAWAFWRPVSGTPTPNRPNLKDCISSYVRNDQVWWCPSWSGVYGVNAWGNPQGSGFDFVVPDGTSQEVIGKPWESSSNPATYYSEASLQMPSDYPLIWCGSHWTNSLNAHAGISDTAFRAGNERGGTNIAYADGHVKWLPLDWNRWMQVYHTPR